MTRSMLDLYVDIAKTLMERGPLPIHELATLLNIHPHSLKKRLNFLTDNEMVKEKDGGSIVTFVIAERGAEFLRFFKIHL
jgi:predicted transcriptional regulator